ncbi:MAG: TolC family protein [Candidatus Melainabacteria bacterium]|nr:TolC family protein [Candidatus Melainabacteria bacterium]
MKLGLRSGLNIGIGGLCALLLAGNCLPVLAQLRPEPNSISSGTSSPSGIPPLSPLGLTDTPGSASLDQLYPEPKGGLPFSSSAPDMVLTGAELDKARSISLGQINMSELLPIGRGKLPPIKLEAAYNEQLSLKQALLYALGNNLPIRISQAGYEAQRYQFLGSLGNFLPDFTLTYRGQRTDTQRGTGTPFFTNSATIRYPLFQGGSVLFNSLASMNRAKAGKNAFHASINDTMFSVYQRYNDLLLAHLLLRIRVKSVELSRAQVALNQQLKDAGVGTNFAIYQSRTQLALDKQALLQQQVALRQAALQLALLLNTNIAINFLPEEERVSEAKLFSSQIDVNRLETAAAKYRPELKQFEFLRRAADRNIQVAAAPLYPSFQFFTTKTVTKSGGGGGNNNLTGSTVIIPTGGNGGGSIGISGGGGRSFSAGFDLSWNLNGFGVVDAGNTLAARALARQAMLQSNQQIITVLQQVRSSYLNMLTAEAQVDVAGEAVVSATEQLRLANLRLRYGQGINLELIQAQREYINSLTLQAQAIIAYNVSQAQLLRDTGLISVATLTAEARPNL